MKHAYSQVQKGIGLIEVLIAVVVVAVGLLVLASLQGTLMRSSGDTKAHSEAMVLAQDKIEEFRNSMSSGDFESIASGNDGGPIAGTNASFTRSWTVTDKTAFWGLDRKQIAVTVTWGGGGADQTVYTVTELAWNDPFESALTSPDSGGTAAVPSPRQNASEDVRPASETVDPNDVISPTQTPLPYTATVDPGDLAAVGIFSTSVVGNDSNSYTLTRIAPDSHYFATDFGEGVLAVYLCLDDGSCAYIQNHFGGVVLSTAGTVYTVNGNDLSTVHVAWTSSDVTACYQGSVTSTGSGPNTVYSMPYECVYAGNCNTTADINGCSANVTDAQINARNVGPGGEFGDIGLVGLDGGNGGDQLCFLEDTPYWDESKNILNGHFFSGGGNVAGNEDYLLPVTKRFYVARRMMSNGTQRSEGINKSYRNHNFLLVNRVNSPNAYKNCYDAVNVDYPGSFDLAQREVVRLVGTSSNTVDTESTFAGTMPGITIKASSDNTAVKPFLYINEIGSCYVKNDNSSYACIVPNNTGDVNIQGGNANYPTPTSASPPVSVNYDDCSSAVNTANSNNLASPCNWHGNF